jgi:DNA polymerase-1
MSDAPRLFLIDGYALIYRAFFAMISRPLTTSRGENTSAAWGVANFLHRLFEQYRPQFVAWVNDSGSSFREEIYPEYKATRDKLDDELQEDFNRSLERIEELLRAWRVPLVTLEGYEADDVLGSLAAEGRKAGLDVVIVSGDKDFYQLIGPGVSLLNPGRRGPSGIEEHWVDESNADERLGVPPNRVIDYLALVGDSSDNVPGVRGVGDKTARKLIEQFGDLDSILARAAEVTGKRAREALLREADQARLSRDLVTLRTDLPITFDPAAFEVGTVDRAALRAVYSELEFTSLVDRIGDPTVQEPDAVRYRIVDETADLEQIVAAVQRAGRLGIDVVTSTTAVMGAEIVGLSIAVGEDAWYLPFGHRPPGGELLTEAMPKNLPALDEVSLAAVRAIFADAGIDVVGHDLKRAVLALRSVRMALEGLAFDTMLASFVIDPGRRSHALDVLAHEFLGTEIGTLAALRGTGRGSRTLDLATPEQVARCSCARVRSAVLLEELFITELDARGGRGLFTDIEMPLIDVLADLETAGIKLDRDAMAKLAARFQAELGDLERQIHEEAGTDFNINSTQQLRHILFEKLQLPVIKRTKTGPSTDADVLGELAAQGHTLPSLLLEYRELAKLQSTYVDALPQSIDPRTGRIHTTFSQTGAATGRLSSSDPNLQNIPVRTERGEEIRRCFVAEDGRRLLVADYSQIELRLLAHFSQDEAFLRAFHEGGDVHRQTASVIFDVDVSDVTGDMRARAKTINFATIYGQGPFSLARQLGISQDEAKDFIRLYFERFAGVREYLDECVERARRQGYAETLFGRRRYIPELKDRNYNIRAFGERVAMNSPLQGSAADLIKRAMIGIWRSLRDARHESRLLLQVHDELVVECPRDEVDEVTRVVKHEMEHAADLTVSLVVDVGVGHNWVDAKA